ncbi:MAG TPA: aspartyl protease family protein [Vicinamibacterales bacterium]|nr:aspartyl protease family protein [Vicinamibacterales bacterium]
MFRCILCGLLAASTLVAQRSPAPSLRALYDAKKWAELQEALSKAKGHDLYRGAVAVTFHQGPLQAESHLRSVIRAAPKSEEAYEAYGWLSHLYSYSGQYQRLVSALDARWSAFPGRPGEDQERAEVAGFRGLPDQVTVSVLPTTLRHEEHSIFIPLSVNGKAATFFIDTGAWPNVMGESEAKRLGLRIAAASGSMGTMTNRTSFRTAVADELVVGGVRLKNVSFTVLPDDGEPWSLLPPGRRGLIGIPVILAFRTLRWGEDGTVRIGERPASFDVRKANLMLDNDHLAVSVRLEGRTVFGAVDTGAQGTDLFRELAVQFPSILESGTRGSTQVRGVGGAESYASVTLPEITFEIGGIQATLRSQDVLMSRGIRSYIGNFGLDIFQQGRAFKFDFTAMRLELEAAR